MKKYMGNKSKILKSIYQEATLLNPEPCVFFDAFSGTTNVGQFFKKQGYTILSNDINTVSCLLGNVYIKQNTLPSFQRLFESGCYSIRNLKDFETSGRLAPLCNEFITLNHNTNDTAYMESIRETNAFKLLVYLSFAASETDFNDNFKYKLLAPDFVWRNFCFNGSQSEYFNLVSQKSLSAQIDLLASIPDPSFKKTAEGSIDLLYSVYTPPYQIENLNRAIDLLAAYARAQNHDNRKILQVIAKLSALTKRTNHTGRRMFFSEEHGHRIDIINNLTLLWIRDGLINEDEYNYLQCALVESIALFSNTSATYQAFYKTYCENTKQKFRLVVPEIIGSDKVHHVYCKDIFDLIEEIQEPYDILYLDPPYNWRIYDSNYHLLNLMADYNHVADRILEYEKNIAGAAGENRALNHNYTNYNRRNTFEDLLFELIGKAKCRYVIISYSDSLSNHNKNSLSSVDKISAFLQQQELFFPGSYKKVEIESINFESRKSQKKDKINELLFIARKKLEE